MINSKILQRDWSILSLIIITCNFNYVFIQPAPGVFDPFSSSFDTVSLFRNPLEYKSDRFVVILKELIHTIFKILCNNYATICHQNMRRKDVQCKTEELPVREEFLKSGFSTFSTSSLLLITLYTTTACDILFPLKNR